MGLYLVVTRLTGRNVLCNGDVYEEKYGEMGGLTVRITGPFNPILNNVTTVGAGEDAGTYSFQAEAQNLNLSVTAELMGIDKSIDVKPIPDEAPVLAQVVLLADSDPNKMRIIAGYTYPYDKSACYLELTVNGNPSNVLGASGTASGQVDVVIDRWPTTPPVNYTIRAVSPFGLRSNLIDRVL